MSLKILIADDEYWVRENLRGQLASLGCGHEILEPAVDGENALTRVEVERPDLLITDIDMPFMTGNQLIKALKPRYPDLQIVVLSGYSDFSFVREALLDGALDYLLKPVNSEDLQRVVSQVEAHLKRRQTEAEDDALEAEKLLRASSLLRDEALSALLHEGDAAPAAPLGLDWKVYSLLLVNVLDKTALGWNSLNDLRERASKVKSLLEREISGTGRAGVFQNLLVHHEYIVLTESTSPALERLAGRISSHLARFLGTTVEVGASLPFYTLSKVPQAYRQAHSSLLGRTLDSAETVMVFQNSPPHSLQTRITSQHEMLLNLAVASEDAVRIREIIFENVGLKSASNWRLAEIKQTVEYLVGYLTHRSKIPPASRTGLAQEALQGQIDHGLRCRNLGEICTSLEHWIDEVFGGMGVVTSLTMRQTVRQVKDHIHEHYFENLSLATLSESFRVDSSYLSKAYKQVTGTNLMAAIAKCRIDKAKEYIRDRDLSLTEVASLVGYEEYAYFNRVFRKVEGVSPTEYRNTQGRKTHATR